MDAVPITTGRTPAELRALARRERDGRVSARLLALANALDGMSRDQAARAAESGVKRNIPGRCGNVLAGNGNLGWGDVRRDASEAGGAGAARGLEGRGAQPAGDRGPARPRRLARQPRAAAERAAQGRLPAGAPG